MLALLSLLTLVTLFLVVSRVASVALEATGMARDSAQFQARSALMGVGFTTAESDDITTHPVRRKIALYLMTFGNAGIITGVGSFLLTFIGSHGVQTFQRSAVLIGGIVLLLLAFHTTAANRLVDRATRAALNRYTNLDTRDYAALLRIQDRFAITELHIQDGSWMVDKPLSQLHLTREGVVVLGIHRTDGGFVGTPAGDTVIHADDVALAYGRIEVLSELAHRPAATGDRIHDLVADEHQHLVEDERLADDHPWPDGPLPG
jgi:hypothetical protein